MVNGLHCFPPAHRVPLSGVRVVYFIMNSSTRETGVRPVTEHVPPPSPRAPDTNAQKIVHEKITSSREQTPVFRPSSMFDDVRVLGMASPPPRSTTCIVDLECRHLFTQIHRSRRNESGVGGQHS